MQVELALCDQEAEHVDIKCAAGLGHFAFTAGQVQAEAGASSGGDRNGLGVVVDHQGLRLHGSDVAGLAHLFDGQRRIHGVGAHAHAQVGNIGTSQRSIKGNQQFRAVPERNGGVAAQPCRHCSLHFSGGGIKADCSGIVARLGQREFTVQGLGAEDNPLDFSTR